MTALGQAVERDTGLKALTNSYWERLQRFLTSEVALTGMDLDLSAAGAPAKLGLRLKNEPAFKERVQQLLDRAREPRVLELWHLVQAPAQAGALLVVELRVLPVDACRLDRHRAVEEYRPAVKLPP